MKFNILFGIVGKIYMHHLYQVFNVCHYLYIT